MAKLHCNHCGLNVEMPEHCGQPMHLEEVDGMTMLVCHMGAQCARHNVPTHCDAPMAVVD